MPDPNSPADVRAVFVKGWDAASRTAEPDIEQAARPAPPGFTLWRIVGTRSCTLLPALLPNAPGRVLRRYQARIVATLSGTCPWCRATAWIDTAGPDPEHTPAGWALHEVSVGIVHASGCEATFTDADRRWFDSRAVGR